MVLVVFRCCSLLLVNVGDNVGYNFGYGVGNTVGYMVGNNGTLHKVNA